MSVLVNANEFAGKRVLISGGNVDLSRLARFLAD